MNVKTQIFLCGIKKFRRQYYSIFAKGKRKTQKYNIYIMNVQIEESWKQVLQPEFEKGLFRKTDGLCAE